MFFFKCATALSTLCWAPLLTGAVDQATRLFEEYPAAGLQQDLSTFNAIMESCAVAGKVRLRQQWERCGRKGVVRARAILYFLACVHSTVAA